MEDEILITCALRFDGHKYQQQTGFDAKKAIDSFFSNQQWGLRPLELLATFFLLQRSLYKYDLQYEPKDSNFRKVFRSLFFECVDLDIPEEYQQKEYVQAWDSQYKPDLENVKNIVKTNY
ncbi:hypothetical protein VF04_16405 [Nostoc linckia z7]|uniref:Uncharacterized protein n=2 Tax=Nostoc linckia TaxID=92942 RepID=A0A9Q5ZET7_NOSLI|nr:hypothetical protein [Nostoc linckia]PHK42560.1 hypothetical protein VF12_02540 [Nostoc linckia z15]PHJ69585.1 hypothetical protein VF03_23600 [Nostoc linckia z2]PHJ86282.1 hypothetical protein VF07_22245 [Nostoc linckia z6]PHJ96273.1 hypothetical protein VF04_16405 [Nostoc linckia z7]PHK05348.1 hypothetical protein VF08_08200 [Nostoc linckia z8]